MLDTEQKYPQFISNTPLGEDLFEGKSQEAIANCISELLINNDKCKVIGIDGKWGSGKSNLVKIIEHSIKDKYFTFIYDAWGHQEDLQRRSILEELTEALSTCESYNEEKSPLINPKKWRLKLKSLLAKTREVETRIIPKLSIGIILTGLTIIFTPLFSVISDSISQEWLKIVLVSLPVFILFSFFVSSCIKQYNTNKIKKGKNILREALSHFFLIYQGEQKEDTTFEVISEDEPSVKKFRDWMDDISKDLNEVKLLIVFDNMDRLSKEKVQELWSSIHTFFAEASYPNIRVLVPFDRAHINQAFEYDNSPKQIGDDFINKTFNVVFRVSLPILADWKRFFRLKWVEAFNHIDEDEFDRVLQIYDALGKEKTPRNIIAFINEFITINLVIHNFSIPDRYIALFIVGKSGILEDEITEIIAPTFLESLGFLYSSDKDYPKYLASLVYQISPENAIQVVYTQTLKEALNNNESDTVKLISKIPEFTDILRTIIPQLNNLENSILSLSVLSSENYSSQILEQRIWDDMGSNVILKFKLDGLKIKKYQEILLTKISNKELYINYLINGFTKHKSFNSVDYVTSIEKISTLLDKEKEVDVFSLLPDYTTIVEDYIQLLRTTKSKYYQYKIICNIDDFNEYLINLNIEDLEGVTYVPNLSKNLDLSSYVESLKEKLSSSETDLNKIKILIKRYKEVERPMSTLISDVQIYTHFTRINDSDIFYYDLIAMRISRQSLFTNSYISYFENILKSTDSTVVERVAERLEYYMDYGSIMLGLEKFKDYPLYVEVAKKITNRAYGTSRANITAIIYKFGDICKWINTPSSNLLKRLNNWESSHITHEKVPQIPYAFFLATKQSNLSISKQSNKAVIDFLESLDRQQWKGALKNPLSHPFRLTLLFEYKLSQNAYNAFKEVLGEIASRAMEIPNTSSYWQQLIKLVEKQNRKLGAPFIDIRDVFIEKKNMTVELFNFFSEWLFKYSQLAEKKESLAIIIPINILDNNGCLDRIISNKEQIKKMMKIASSTDVSNFSQKIISLKRNHRSKAFKEFVEYLGIKSEKTKKKKKG